jgi:3-hydroxyacyl-[acyl-carrier-protein] dehydratase
VASDIEALIPHRPPFLWVDRILSIDHDRIVAEKDLAADLELYRGHYPQHPITPGVILCEAVFQAGALLIAHGLKATGREVSGVPVLTRIYSAKFKRQVPPGSTITIEASLHEKVGMAWLMKGKVKIGGKTAVSVEFACAESVGEG